MDNQLKPLSLSESLGVRDEVKMLVIIGLPVRGAQS